MDVTAFASALFDGCTLLLISVLFLVRYLHHVSENLSGKIFFGMCLCLSLITISELSDALIRIDGVHSETEIVISMVLCSLYFLGMGVLLLELVLFLFSLLKEENLFKHPLFWILVSLPALGILVLLICNPIFDSFFFDIRLGKVGESTYIRGRYFPFFYILTLIYVLVIACLVFLCYRLLPKRKAITFLGLMFLVAGAVSFQYFFPQIPLGLFVWAICCLLIYLMILRPENYLDPDTGIPGEKAFDETVTTLLLSHREFEIFYLKIVSIDYLKGRYGDQVYIAQMKKIYSFLSSYLKENHLFGEIYFENPGFFKLIVTDRSFSGALATIDIEKILLADKDLSRIASYGSTPFKTTVLSCPEEASTSEAVYNLGRSYDRFLEEDQIFAYGKEILSSREYRLEVDLEQILMEAIEKKSFEIYYQPIYNIQTGRFETAEALVRLHSDKYGFIPPSLFIPMAEKKTMMFSIGSIIFEKVFDFIGSHDLKKISLSYIEINLSLEQCMDPALPEKVKAMEEKYKVNPKNVNFEITESMYGHNDRLIESNLRKLQEMGYSFSLDDYGTGYSNIQRVVDMPFSMIKIDKSLVYSSSSKVGEILLKNTIDMMKNIHKNILVEGIETKDRFEEVKAMGADHIQGFYFSKPRPENDFLAFLKMRNGHKED